MNFQLTEKQLALKQKFEDFFSQEMKNAPASYKKAASTRYFANDETWNFHRYMAKNLLKRLAGRAWPKKYGG